MDKATKEFVLARIDDAMRTVGSNSYEDGVNVVIALADGIGHALRQLDTKEKLEAFLDQLEVPPEELPLLLGAADSLLPLVRTAVSRLADQITEDFPAVPPGRRQALSIQEKQEVRKRIGQLLAQGVALKEAYLRLSQLTGASQRTIRRAWRERKDPLQKASSAEVIEWFQASDKN